MESYISCFETGTKIGPETCAQCRRRKVRCDKRDGICANCERLGLTCSSAPNVSSSDKEAAEILPRRLRGVRACEACREKKIRCSGSSPQCVNCKRRGQPCIYPALKRPIQTFSPQASTSDGDIGSPSSSITEELPALVDAFFEKIYPLPSYAFLHPATTRSRCRDGRVHRALSQAICALAAFYTGRNREDASRWIREAEQTIWEHLEEPTIPRLQTLLLIIHYQMEIGKFQRAFMLAATAARFAAAMRLNHERPDLDPIAREVRRRIVWSLKIVERYFSIGLPEFELCPFESIYLELPAPEEDFGADQPGDYGSYSLHVRLESVRRDIMKLNRGIALCDQPFPLLTKVIHDVERNLRDIGARMPAGTELSFAELSELLDNPWLPRRILMHISWHQCYCDLYRLLLRGYPEAAPTIVIDAADPSYIAMAERECLRHAASIVQILTNLNQQSTRHYLLEYDTAICAYHATRIFLFISRSGRAADRPSPEFAKSRADLTLAALKRFFPSSALVNPITKELQRIIQNFAQQTQTNSRTTPRDALQTRGSNEQSLPSPMEVRQRLAIHSLLRQAEFPHDDADERLVTQKGSERRVGTSYEDTHKLPAREPTSVTGTGSDLSPPTFNFNSSASTHSDYQNHYDNGWILDPLMPDQAENWQLPLFALFGRQDLDTFFGSPSGS